jgi:hypothetical protein
VSVNHKRAITAAITFTVAVLALVSAAIADPGGWAWWRVILAGWPAGTVFAGLAATFPFQEPAG